MAIYKRERRPKSYSLKDGQFLIGGQDDFSVDTSGPARKSEIEDTPLEKAGLTNNDPKEEKEKEIKLDEATAQSENIEPKDNVAGTTAIEEEKEEVNPTHVPDPNIDPVASQQFLFDKGYLKGDPSKSVNGKWDNNSIRAQNDYYRAEGIIPPNAQKLDALISDLGVSQKTYVGNKDKVTHINGERVEFRTGEASSGGEVTPKLLSTAKAILGPLSKAVKGVRVTGGNDAYHISDEYYAQKWKTKKGISKELSPEQLEEARAFYKENPSDHVGGNAMDIAVTAPWKKPKEKKEQAASRTAFIAKNRSKIDGALASFEAEGYVADENGKWYTHPNGSRILNEYDHPSKGASAPHFHIEGDKH